MIYEIFNFLIFQINWFFKELVILRDDNNSIIHMFDNEVYVQTAQNEL